MKILYPWSQFKRNSFRNCLTIRNQGYIYFRNFIWQFILSMQTNKTFENKILSGMFVCVLKCKDCIVSIWFENEAFQKCLFRDCLQNKFFTYIAVDLSWCMCFCDYRYPPRNISSRDWFVHNEWKWFTSG